MQFDQNAAARIRQQELEMNLQHQIRVEWRKTDPETGKQNTQTDVIKKKKTFELKREAVTKADRRDDKGAALRGMASSLAGNTDKAMDGQQRALDQLGRLQLDFMDRMLAMQERHLDRLDEEQASVVDLMDERADLIAEVKLAELRAELQAATGQQALIIQGLGLVGQIATPLVELAMHRLGGGAITSPTPRPAPDRLQALESKVEQLHALLAPPPPKEDPADGTGADPA